MVSSLTKRRYLQIYKSDMQSKNMCVILFCMVLGMKFQNLFFLVLESSSCIWHEQMDKLTCRQGKSSIHLFSCLKLGHNYYVKFSNVIHVYVKTLPYEYCKTIEDIHFFEVNRESQICFIECVENISNFTSA